MHKISQISVAILVIGMSAHAAVAQPAQPRGRNAQALTPPPSQAEMAATYEAISKLPDWSGTWVPDNPPSILRTNAPIPLTDKFVAQLVDLRKSISSGKTVPPANPLCKPFGMPMFMQSQGPTFDILYAPNRVIMQSGYHEGRIIYTDGRKIVDDPDLDFYDGTSVGHWEGDTLVVQTTGLLADAQFLPGLSGSQNLHIAERIRLIGPNKLEDVITLTDPDVFTKPYTYTSTLTRHRNWDVTEYDCLSGKAADYGTGVTLAPQEDKQSSTANPPVREIAKPAPNAASLPGGTWQSIAQLPDWVGNGGIWNMDRGQPNEHHTTEVIPLTTVYAQRLEDLRNITKVGGDIPTDDYHCRPRGPAQLMKSAVSVFYFVFTPGQVTLVPEIGEERRFYTDGRGHPDHIVPSFYGHSIGHWDGDTLVVDTVGLRRDVQTMDGEIGGGNMHMVERFQQTSPGKMTVDTTIVSAVALKAPWEYKRTFTINRGREHMEEFCTQNNRDVDPKTNMQTFDLTPPPN